MRPPRRPRRARVRARAPRRTEWQLRSPAARRAPGTPARRVSVRPLSECTSTWEEFLREVGEAGDAECGRHGTGAGTDQHERPAADGQTWGGEHECARAADREAGGGLDGVQ